MWRFYERAKGLKAHGIVHLDEEVVGVTEAVAAVAAVTDIA